MKAGWQTTPLAELCEVFGDGDWIESKDQSADGVRLIQTGNVGEGVFKDRGEKARYISEETFKRLRCTEIFAGDCLISRLPDPAGRSCILPETGRRMITAVDCTIVRFKANQALPAFFNYYTQSRDYLSTVDGETTGTTRKRISRSKLAEVAIPVPPLTEQQRIVTVLGAILFATRLGDFDAGLARKAVRFIAYDGKNRAATVTHRHDGQKGYAVGFEGLVDYINGLLPKNEHIGSALRKAHALFPELAIRELVANALIHQDMTVTGAGPQIELFSDRIEISNPGAPLVKADRMIDLPPRSRNEALASLMRRMGICEEQGSGLDKVLEQVELFQLPPPLFRAEENSTQAVLYGPRGFAAMTPEERVRACYFHAVLRFLGGDKMKNASLCTRLGIAPKNAAQATAVINKTLEAKLIRVSDPDHPRAGYVPHWA